MRQPGGNATPLNVRVESPTVRLARPRLLLGWRERVALPELGVPCIRAKIDSGARSSSLHVHDQEGFQRDGEAWVRFMLEHGEDDSVRQPVEARIIDERVVTDSGGHRSSRVFICTLLSLSAGQSWPIEINLSARCNMQFPMLLGRSALRRRCLVEPSRSFLLGTPGDVGGQ